MNVRPEVGGNVMVAASLGADTSTTGLDDLEQRLLEDLVGRLELRSGACAEQAMEGSQE